MAGFKFYIKVGSAEVVGFLNTSTSTAVGLSCFLNKNLVYNFPSFCLQTSQLSSLTIIRLILVGVGNYMFFM